MPYAIVGAMFGMVVLQFSALWYRMGRIEGQLRKMNGGDRK